MSFKLHLFRAADGVTDSGDSESEDFDLGIDAKTNVAETKKVCIFYSYGPNSVYCYNV